MGIDDISGKRAGFWMRAKAALTGNLSDPATPPPASPRPEGDTAQLSSKGHYFAGYALPESAESGEPASPGETGKPSEAKVWAPLVITPDSPES